jgi:hypothetical protein
MSATFLRTAVEGWLHASRKLFDLVDEPDAHRHRLDLFTFAAS